MLRSDLIAGKLLDSFLGARMELACSQIVERIPNVHIAQRNHADRLPDAKTDSRSNATVKALHSVVRVDVPEGGCDIQVLRAIGVNRLGLELNTDDLNGLVPRAQTTTKGRGGDLLEDTELLTVLLIPDTPDASFRNTGQPETRSPVGDLAHRYGVDTTVDTAETLRAPNSHKGLDRTGRLCARGCDLVLGDLDRLHAGAESHGGISLRKTTGHTSRDTSDEVGCTKRLGVVFGFGGDEEEDSALGGGFNPGPWNETLVDCAVD